MKNKRLINKEFGREYSISTLESGGHVLHFKFGDVYEKSDFENMAISLVLTKKEWGNFLIFLKRTKKKKYLPKDSIAYSEFDIDTNRYTYCKRGFMKTLEFYKSFNIQLTKVDIVFLRKKYKERNKDYNKHFLSNPIWIRKKDIAIVISRKKFIKLRDFVLYN